MLELSKILVYEFSHDYLKPKCGKKEKLYWLNTDSLYSFIVYIKTDDIYKDFAENIETRFDGSN